MSMEIHKNLIVIASLLVFSYSSEAQVWMSKDANIGLFSDAPLEDIKAESDKCTIALNAKTGKVYAKVKIKSFKFESSLMEDHFNENYMESERYPHAVFNGQIDKLPDFTKDGTYDLEIKGTFEIHGVKKKANLKNKLIVKGDKINATSKFTVKCEDYNIEIPKIVVKNIAEEIEITIQSDFKPYKK